MLKKEVDYCADVDLWMRIMGAGHCGIFMGDQYWSCRSIYDSQRGAVALEKFAEASKKSIDFWLASVKFPKQLEQERACIEAIGYIRRATYYNTMNETEKAIQNVLDAIEISPKIAAINYIVNLMALLGIPNEYKGKFTFIFIPRHSMKIKIPKMIV
jgi:hypothetical protein